MSYSAFSVGNHKHGLQHHNRMSAQPTNKPKLRRTVHSCAIAVRRIQTVTEQRTKYCMKTNEQAVFYLLQHN